MITNERSEDSLTEESFVGIIWNFHSRSELKCVGESEETIPIQIPVAQGEPLPKSEGPLVGFIDKEITSVTQDDRSNRTVEEGAS